MRPLRGERSGAGSRRCASSQGARYADSEAGRNCHRDRRVAPAGAPVCKGRPGAGRPVLAVVRRCVMQGLPSGVINGRSAPASVALAQVEGPGVWCRRVGGIPNAVCAGRSGCPRAPVAGARRRPRGLLLWRRNILSGWLAGVCRAGGRTLFRPGGHPGSGAGRRDQGQAL